MEIVVKIPLGQKLEPGTRVQVSVDGGEWQDQVVQPASYGDGSDGGGRYLLSLPGQPNVWG